MTRNKNPFFAVESTQMTKIMSPKTENKFGWGSGAVWRHKSCKMFVSLVFVKCLSNETYISLLILIYKKTTDDWEKH